MAGPFAPQSNPPVNAQYYEPTFFTISNITKGRTTVVTMNDNVINGETITPNYVVGQEVKILMTFGYGMRQISNRKAYVLSLPSASSVEIDIDSRDFNDFIPNPTYSITPSQIVAIGSINSGQINSNGRINNLVYIPGSFINISPS